MQLVAVVVRRPSYSTPRRSRAKRSSSAPTSLRSCVTVAFSERTVTDAADDPPCVFAVDVDGDADNDVLTVIYADDTVAWFENDLPESSFAEHIITTQWDGPNEALSVDFDLDGDA